MFKNLINIGKKHVNLNNMVRVQFEKINCDKWVTIFTIENPTTLEKEYCIKKFKSQKDAQKYMQSVLYRGFFDD